MLRQSGLSAEDKKKILMMTNGQLELSKVDQAMRSLSTCVLLGPGETKKKVYPINFPRLKRPPHLPMRAIRRRAHMQPSIR